MTSEEKQLIQRCSMALGWHMNGPEMKRMRNDKYCMEWRVGFSTWIRGREREEHEYGGMEEDIYGAAKELMGNFDPRLKDALHAVIQTALEQRLAPVLDKPDAEGK